MAVPSGVTTRAEFAALLRPVRAVLVPPESRRHNARGIRGPIETVNGVRALHLHTEVTTRAEFAALLRQGEEGNRDNNDQRSQRARNSRPY